MNIIFLDIDGVLNGQFLYEKSIKGVKKELKNKVKKNAIGRDEFYASQLCTDRISWLNELCISTESKVVISSTWRKNKTIPELQTILNNSGANFEIIGFTPDLRHEHCVRGNEIYSWIERNKEYLCITSSSDFNTYVIIDDDSDMLYWQRNNLFLTDCYSGLTPNICYKIKRFFSKLN